VKALCLLTHADTRQLPSYIGSLKYVLAILVSNAFDTGFYLHFHPTLARLSAQLAMIRQSDEPKPNAVEVVFEVAASSRMMHPASVGTSPASSAMM